MNNDLPELPVYGFAPDMGGLLGLILTIILPIIVNLVTTKTTSAGMKGVLLLALAALKTVIESWLMAVNKDVEFAVVPVLLSVLVNFGIAVTIHFGLYKPTGITSTKAPV